MGFQKVSKVVSGGFRAFQGDLRETSGHQMVSGASYGILANPKDFQGVSGRFKGFSRTFQDS